MVQGGQLLSRPQENGGVEAESVPKRTSVYSALMTKLEVELKSIIKKEVYTRFIL